MWEYICSCCKRKNEKATPKDEEKLFLPNNNLEILIETEQNINLIKKHENEIKELDFIIKDMTIKIRLLEQELEKKSNINNFENTESQLLLSQTLYITHLENSLQELNSKELDAVPKSDFDQQRNQLYKMQNDYNTLVQYYGFYKNYYDESIIKAQGSNPPEEQSSS